MISFIKKIIPESLIIYLWKILPMSPKLKKNLVWHMNNHFVVSVTGVVFNDNNEVLLLHHTYRTEPWALPGGWMEYEQPEKALEREIFEETGFNIKVSRINKVIYGKMPHRIELILLGKYEGGEFRPSPEVSNYGFFKIGEWPSSISQEQIGLIEEIYQEYYKTKRAT